MQESRIQLTLINGRDGYFYCLEWRPFIQDWVIYPLRETDIIYPN